MTTISQLIERLMESGDQKYRDTMPVRLVDDRHEEPNDIDLFDVKDTYNGVDIHYVPDSW